MLWESVTDSCDVCQCTRLFNNAFNIRSTPEESMKSKPKARRLLGMASRRLINSDNVSPSMNKENSIPVRNLNLDSSPYKNPYGTKKARYPLEDFDQNGQDRGYRTNEYQDREDKGCNGFQFAEPLGVAPRRLSLECRSPMRSPIRSSPQAKRRGTQPSLFRSLSSGYESMDDGFNDLIDIDNLDEMTRLPNGISSLISGEIVAASSEKIMECDQATTPEFPRTKMNNLRRSLSLTNERFDKSHNNNNNNNTGTPPFSKVRSCLFRSPNASSSTAKLSYDENRKSKTPDRFSSPSIVKSFKRPEPPSEDTPTLVKRSRKSSSLQGLPEAIVNHRPKCLQRSLSQSDAHADIDSAIHRSTTDSDLTGDFSKPCILPLASGVHEDLKSISSDTLAALINGEFQDRVSTFKIVDCRYPYEFEAGHIKGAVNLYSKDLIEQFLLNPLTHTPEIQPDENKRSILVFHCEFSWERGPNLSRFLRSIDRQRNKEHYPALHYPEMYLLHGGYEQFYKAFKEYCAPQGYRPMKHPDHEADLRMFRSKSKSWQGEKTRLTGSISRTNLKRLGF